MKKTDLEEPESVGEPEVWPEYRHFSTQRMQTFRFSMGFLGVFSGALTWLLLQDTGPWICTPLALLLSILSIALIGLEWQSAARLRDLQSLLRSQGVEGTAQRQSGERSGKRDAWPIDGAYAAFAILGLFFGALPIWARQVLPKPRMQEDSAGRTNPDRRFPMVTPLVGPPNLPPATPPSFGNPRQFPGITPIQMTPFVRPPIRTPPLRQLPPGSPTASTATPAP